MKKFNNYLKLGVFFNGLFILSNRTNLAPDFISCFCCGLGLTLCLIGMYAENNDISKLKNYKRNILNKVLLN